MKIYLASPFFNEKELENVKIAEKILTERGFSLFSPRLNEVRTDEITQQSWWSKETFMNDKKFIDWADVVVMLYYGGYSDSGTAWECGYAYGTNTPVVVVQLGEDSNLMVHEGCHSNITLEELKTYDFEMLPAKPYKGKMF
ncbi:nucleoside 2-deoxyribosyltransferase [Ruminococcus sp. LCP21S3_E8]|nr:nucleoside 2-deoxyribosyltransferase [Ruminococcus sp.]MCI6506324.1 nucleoside 2-deoxyribosyltransferase [Ruminococcus sp.]